MNALFGAKKNDPPAVAVTPAGYAIYQVTEIQPAQTPTFDQIKAKVEEQFKDQRAQTMLAQKTQELSDRAHSEHDLAKAAKEVGATVKTSDLGRQDFAGAGHRRDERARPVSRLA